jgi:hypothetical protein
MLIKFLKGILCPTKCSFGKEGEKKTLPDR